MATQIQVITDANIQYGLAYDETTKQLKIDTDKVVDYAAFDPIKKDIIDSIDTEIQRATDTENVITTNLDTEIQRAIAKENEINQALSAEVSRATKAESDLDSKVNAEIERANNQESALDGKITAEANRATTAEGNLNATLMQEIARSGQTDQTLNENLTAEIQRATGAENTITGNLDAEIERATAKENEINQALQIQIGTSGQQIQTLNQNLTAETDRATAKENEIINQTIPSCLKDAKDYCDDKLESVNQSINGLSQNLTNHTTESQQQFQAINTSITELGNTKLDKSNPHITGDITVDGVVKLFGDSDTADLSTNEGIVSAIKMILQKLGMLESNITEPQVNV